MNMDDCVEKINKTASTISINLKIFLFSIVYSLEMYRLVK